MIFGPEIRPAKLAPWRFVRLKCDGCGCQTPRVLATVGGEHDRCRSQGWSAGWAMNMARDGKAIQLCPDCRPDRLDLWKARMRGLRAGGAA